MPKEKGTYRSLGGILVVVMFGDKATGWRLGFSFLFCFDTLLSIKGIREVFGQLAFLLFKKMLCAQPIQCIFLLSCTKIAK